MWRLFLFSKTLKQLKLRNRNFVRLLEKENKLQDFD
jgi:uncharacterized protein YdcH (DUF465 family)